MERIVEQLRQWAADLEPGLLSGEQAVRLLATITEAERICAAVRTLVARRVEQSNVWVRSGTRTAAEFVALQVGSSVHDALETLATAERLEHTPATADAFLAGKVSERQATEVSKAAAVDPSSEERLLGTAERRTMKQLQDECRRVRLATSDDAEQYARIHRDRFFRTWTDPDGAFCGRFATTPDIGAKMAAVLAKAADRRFNQASKAGEQEPLQAYAMDALASVVCGSEPVKGTKLVINAVVDYTTLMSKPGEGGTCEVAGLGPVPVTTLHEWEGDRYLRLLVKDGVDIRTVTRTTRFIDQRQRAALLVREGLTCCIQGCDQAAYLEIDHHQRLSDGGPTETANLGPKCRFHHRLKDVYGWKLVGGPGRWRLEPP